MAHRPTAAQLRARKRFAAMARSGSFRRNPKVRIKLKRRAKARPAATARKRLGIRSPFDAGEHRPRVHVIRGRKLERFRPKSPYKGVITRANPAKGRTMKRRKRSRVRTPVSYRRRRRSTRRRNPEVLANPRRRRVSRRPRARRGYRRNPMGLALPGLNKLVNKALFMNGLLVFGGLVAGIKGAKYINLIPFVNQYPRFHGLVHLAVAALVAAKGKSQKAYSVALGIAAAGMWDLATKNFPTMFALPSPMGVDIMGEEINGAEIAAEIAGEGEEVVGDDFEGDSGVVVLGSGYNSNY